MCHLRHRLRIFLFRRKVMFRSQDIQVFVFLTIPWFTKSVTSWWVLVHETEFILKIIITVEITRNNRKCNFHYVAITMMPSQIWKFVGFRKTHKFTIMDIIFWDFLLLYQIFFSSQVKRSVIISNKHGIYKLPNDLRLRILEN